MNKEPHIISKIIVNIGFTIAVTMACTTPILILATFVCALPHSLILIPAVLLIAAITRSLYKNHEE